MTHCNWSRHRFRHINVAVGSCIDICDVLMLVSFGMSEQGRFPASGPRNTELVSYRAIKSAWRLLFSRTEAPCYRCHPLLLFPCFSFRPYLSILLSHLLTPLPSVTTRVTRKVDRGRTGRPGLAKPWRNVLGRLGRPGWLRRPSVVLSVLVVPDVLSLYIISLFVMAR